jgi:Ca-activated chloride channel homolog
VKFLLPEALALLIGVPVLVAVYVLLLRRKKKYAVSYPALGLVKEASGLGSRWRRHVPPLLLLLSIAAAIVAVARPTAVVTLPSQQRTVILAVDVSLSMSAADVDPNRITAAKVAAKAFVDESPAFARIGLVAFGGSASLVQPPTDNREELLAAIDRFQLQRATATGSALYVALAALLPDAGIDLDTLLWRGPSTRDPARRLDAKSKAKEEKAKPPVRPGSFTSGVIILMSDGRRTTGPDPLEAAKLAADHGVRVFTVGFGTAAGTLIGGEGWSAYVRLDEEALKAVADITRGAYFHAATAAELKTVYQSLNAQLVLEKKDTEITSLFASVAAVLMLASLALSVLWFNREA